MTAVDAVTLIAESAPAQIAGFLILHFHATQRETQAYVVTLDVTPERRRSGLGRLLMDEAEARAKTARAASMTLHASAENAGALAFYERLGYVRVLLHPDFYDPGLGAWSYDKPIGI